MNARPEWAGERFVARFQEQGVVDRYHLRGAYPPETFTILNSLIVDEPRVTLDVGCGPGNIARPLARFVERVDAMDISAPMLARGKTLPGGDAPNIRWLQGRAEEMATEEPYALITAGASLHWMDWDSVMPRFARELTPRGALAILHLPDQPHPWSDGYREIARRFTTNPTYAPFDLLGELERRHLFQRLGETTTAPVAVHQSVEDFIAGQHGRSNFSLEAMTTAQASQFDAALRELLTPFARDGALILSVVAGIAWGRPLNWMASGE